MFQTTTPRTVVLAETYPLGILILAGLVCQFFLAFYFRVGERSAGPVCFA